MLDKTKMITDACISNMINQILITYCVSTACNHNKQNINELMDAMERGMQDSLIDAVYNTIDKSENVSKEEYKQVGTQTVKSIMGAVRAWTLKHAEGHQPAQSQTDTCKCGQNNV